ncbi:MAG: hypothetical protein GY805_30390, partial [Chloroflexi bacterium]|nr:hypothetical protein [Chloroflexota bacterium]
MLNAKSKRIGQLVLISFLSIGLLISLNYWLSGVGTQTAVAAPTANITVNTPDDELNGDGD